MGLGVGWDEVLLCGSDPEWPAAYAAEATRIRRALEHRGLSPIELEHVGSTAVPGLPAKPVIDILVGVETRFDEVLEVLLDLGYRFHTRKDRGDRVFLWRGEGNRSTHHVNVTSVGSLTWTSLLRLRDLLRADPDARRQYADAKWALARRHAGDRLAYREGKSTVISALLEK